MHARVRCSWTNSISANLARQTLEVIANGVSWGEKDVALASTIDLLIPENTASVQLKHRSYNQSNHTGDGAAIGTSFSVPAAPATPATPPTTPPVAPPAESLCLPATGLSVAIVGYEQPTT